MFFCGKGVRRRSGARVSGWGEGEFKEREKEKWGVKPIRLSRFSVFIFIFLHLYPFL